MAFYRIENESLFKAEDNIFGPGYDLLLQDYETYEYPLCGWYWFDTDEDAKINLGYSIIEN